MGKKRFEIEYAVNSSPKVLYARLNTASGLSEWFADDVILENNIFTFIWEGTAQRAEKVLHKDNKVVRYRWLDEEDDSYFEFKIIKRDLTGDVALLVTDFADEDEVEDAKDLWNKQIEQLCTLLGSGH
ncbi:MAG: SRPBCC domain-containing protein [Bacteroidales bacterium]|nr:SRPBCC domain-containing protein [Bacteroidales bacterium]